jgi:hypothetical protein
VNEESVAALAEAVGLPLRPESAGAVAELLGSLTREGGGVTPDEVASVEPASSFDPAWPS